MAVNLKNFVKINLNYFKATTANGIRDTAVLFETEDTTSTHKLLKVDGTYSSMADFEDPTVWSGNAGDNLYKYVRCFFENGGKKLRIIRMPAPSGSETVQGLLLAQLEALPMEQVVVASTASETTMRALAALAAADTKLVGINEKMIVSHIDAISGFDFTGLDAFDNYILKLNNKVSGTNDSAGSEMSILAYLTKVNVYGSNPIADYCYTLETAKFEYNLTPVTPETKVVYSYITEDNSAVETIIENNSNADTILVGNVRVVGGNTTSGKDLVNHFVKIVLSQTITERLVKLLTNKIRYNQTGINLISNTIVTEMNKYRTFGYLSTSKIWENEDLYVDVNGKEYLIISKNEPLLSGYKFVILPFESLTSEQKQKHLLPNVYLLVADSYAIRKIEISGWVY